MVHLYQIVSYIPLNTIAYVREKKGCIRECRCVGVGDEHGIKLDSSWEIAGFTELGILRTDSRIYVDGKEIGCLFCSEADAQFNAWYTSIDELYEEIHFKNVIAKCYPSVEVKTCRETCYVKIWSVKNQELREENANFHFYFNDDGELRVYIKDLEELTCYATKEDAINHFPKVDVIRLNEPTKIGNQNEFVTIKVDKKRWDDFKKFVGSVK